LGIEYKGFATETGKEIGGFFDETLRFYLRKAAIEAKDDAAWDAFGKEISDKVLKGMGFENLAQFREFVTKGTITPVGHSYGDDRREPRHEGGAIGGAGSSRAGRRGGLRSDEKYILAQNDEFMVNRKESRKHRSLLEDINTGKYSRYVTKSSRFGKDTGVGGKSPKSFRESAKMPGICGGQTPGIYPAAGYIGGVIAQGYGKAVERTLKELKARAAANAHAGGGSGASGNVYVPGAGGRHRPVAGGTITNGLHPTSAIDIGVPVGTPVFAIADGRVSASYDIPGYEPRQPDGGNGYRSYGRVITIDHGGFSSLMAHLSARGVGAGAQVKGGARIGLSGDTGNSSGPHLHFGTPGANPYDFMGLRKGAANINVPGLYNLHEDEGVLTEDLNRQYHEGMKKWADGPAGDTIHVKILVDGKNHSVKEIADEVESRFEKKIRRKPRKRRS
jgi:murein DD-endopeptidase MepM/ murein hydrolase activator NlpD